VHELVFAEEIQDALAPALVKPDPVPELDRYLNAFRLLGTRENMCVPVAVGNKPTGKLEDDGAELPCRFKRLQGRAESLPQFICNFGR
jgi:hypothetical protein